jgi:hypothetical protein
MFSRVLGYEAVSCIELIPKFRMIVALHLKEARSPKKNIDFVNFNYTVFLEIKCFNKIFWQL